MINKVYIVDVQSQLLLSLISMDSVTDTQFPYKTTKKENIMYSSTRDLDISDQRTY